MKPISFFLIGIIALYITACKFKVELNTKDKIRNGIKLKADGLHVSQAFLLDDDGNLITEDNLVKVNENINLRLIIDSGWIIKNDSVKIGAREIVVSSDDEVLIDSKDIFAGNDIVGKEQARVITLNVIINKISKLYDYYEVNFRVWDKKGPGEITGSYRFNVK